MSTSRLFLTVTTAFLSAATLHAAGLAEPSSSAAANPKYELKKRSSFSLPETTRAPFWPIGWTKQNGTRTEVAAVVTQQKPVLDERNFSVTSILLGNPSLAVINGRSYTEGEMLRMPRGSAPAAVRVRVQRITDGAVELAFADQIIKAKLRREQLEPKQGTSEELLPLDDR